MKLNFNFVILFFYFHVATFQINYFQNRSPSPWKRRNFSKNKLIIFTHIFSLIYIPNINIQHFTARTQKCQICQQCQHCQLCVIKEKLDYFFTQLEKSLNMKSHTMVYLSIWGSGKIYCSWSINKHLSHPGLGQCQQKSSSKSNVKHLLI